MGAAIEGAFYNIPSIGLSLTDHDPDADFEGAIKFGTQIVESVLNGELPQPLCLNVNVPNIPCAELKGIRLSRQTRGYWREEFFERTDPGGSAGIFAQWHTCRLREDGLRPLFQG